MENELSLVGYLANRLVTTTALRKRLARVTYQNVDPMCSGNSITVFRGFESTNHRLYLGTGTTLENSLSRLAIGVPFDLINLKIKDSLDKDGLMLASLLDSPEHNYVISSDSDELNFSEYLLDSRKPALSYDAGRQVCDNILEILGDSATGMVFDELIVNLKRDFKIMSSQNEGQIYG
ncbi:MAG: hypothetical protein AABX94_01760 [Nanoarchaeota archaeon]